ncbi:MAG: ribokinase [Clostridia bacterium]|nr:ribokinase [Clostridia bacterium]
MRFLNFGSLNLDHVYTVDHFVKAGETLASQRLDHFLGGKGLNQSIALARAGAEVFHAGRIGTDGEALRAELDRNGVDTTLLVTDILEVTGHAVIQNEKGGNNCILLYGGANLAVTEEDAHRVISHFGEGDWLLLQNEISSIPVIIREAKKRGMTVVLNPSPISGALLEMPELSLVDWFILNEVEGEAMTGETVPDAILSELSRKFPSASVVLTLGADGAVCFTDGKKDFALAMKVKAVDTTAAGDTFTGFFFATLTGGGTPAESLRIATAAAAKAVSVKGASNSIPRIEDLGVR